MDRPAESLLFLALETSCDETAAAVFTGEPRVLSSVIASQDQLHARFTGVVPEIAARAHLRHLRPVVAKSLAEAGVTIHEIGAVAVHNRPGLMGSLLVGVSAAKMLAAALDVPLLAVNHVAAHIYACRLSAGRDIYPCLGLVVSGGHTALFDCPDPLSLNLLGSTRDDAAGEAFDKVAAMMGLGFPGGPAVERTAAAGDPLRFKFPRAFAHEDRLEFSFSGLKTSVLYALRDLIRGSDPGGELEKTSGSVHEFLRAGRHLIPAGAMADVAASFQRAVADILAIKAGQALRATRRERLAVGGGVTANREVREALARAAASNGAELLIPPMNLCTDNAAMAALAVEAYRRGIFAPLDLEASPRVL